MPRAKKGPIVPVAVVEKASPKSRSKASPKKGEALLDKNLKKTVPKKESAKKESSKKEPAKKPASSPKTTLLGRMSTPDTDKDGFVTLNGFFKIHKGTYNILRRNILKRVNTLILGPTGYGKTEMVYEMAKHLGAPITIFDMGTMTDPIMGLVGTNTIQVHKGKTTSRFIKSRFSDVIQKPGIVLLDELSRASLQANNLLFPCLDFRRELSMEYAFNDSAPIKIHPKCVFFATANIGSQYSGTNKIDRALLDRFMLIEMDRLQNSQIVSVLSTIYPRIPESSIKVIVEIYEKINKANDDFTISFGLSFRHLRTLASLVQDGFTIYDAYYTMCKGLASKEGLKSIESILSVSGSKSKVEVVADLKEPDYSGEFWEDDDYVIIVDDDDDDDDI